jgi:hypothetical protein
MDLKNKLDETAVQIRETELRAIVEAWLNTSTGKSFHQTPYYWQVLTESMNYDATPLTVEKLNRHFHKLLPIYEFTREAAAAKAQKELEQSEARQRANEAAERLRIWNLPTNVAAREQERIKRETAEEKRTIEGFWKPAFPSEDSHSRIIRATRETENYQRRKLGFPERS